MDIRVLRQNKADNDAAQATYRAEVLRLAAIDKPTDEQKAELKAAEEKYDTAVQAAVEITNKLRLAEKFAEEEKKQGHPPKVDVGKNHAEDEPYSMGEFLQAVACAGAGGAVIASKIGFVWKDNLRAAVSGASAGDSATGGALVRKEWSTSLLGKIEESSNLLSKCTVIDIGEGFDGIEAPYVNETSRATGSRWGGVQVYRAAEAASVTAKQASLGVFKLDLADMKGLFYATDRVLRDATLLESLNKTAFSSEFAFKLDDELIRGTGGGQCLGVLNAGCAVTQDKESGQTNDTIKAENVIKMYNRLLARNIGRAEWYVNQECLEQLLRMSVAVGTAGGQLVYMPPGGLSTSPYGTLMGRPVNVLEQASGLGDVGDIIFADFSEMIVIRKPMTNASSMHVRFIFDEMTFRWTWPINAKPALASAITPYKATTATSLSPFVLLQAR